MATTTRVNVERGTLRKLGIYTEGALTAATTTLLTSSTWPFRTNIVGATDRRFEGNELYIYGSANAVAPNPNGVAYDASAGTFTPAVDYTTAPAATDTFFLIGGGVRHSDVTEAIDRALGKMRYRTYVPLSLVPDADMDTSGTTDWPSVGSPTTKEKVTTSGNLLRGSQALHVANASASEGVRTASINVDPDDGVHYYVEAKVRAAVGTARLQAYDATNSAAIDADTHDRAGWGKISLSFTLPGTCELLQIRLIGDESTADIYWDDVILYRVGAMEMVLPSWVTELGMVLEVVTARPNLKVPDRDDYAEVWWRIEGDESNPNNQFRVRHDPITSPLWLHALRPFGALSSDTTTTFADRQWVETYAAVELAQEMVNKPGDTTRWRQRLAGLEPVLQRWNELKMGGPRVRRRFPERVGLPSLVY